MRSTVFSSAVAREEFLTQLRAEFKVTELRGSMIAKFAEDNGYPVPRFIFSDVSRRVSRGWYSISVNSLTKAKVKPAPKIVDVASLAETSPQQVVSMTSRRRTADNVSESFVPERNPTYVPFGFFSDLKNIISSKIFYPVYITGLSGNGKTFMVEQVCAALKREMIRVNITRETDETDLIGSYELIDGNTIRREGPAIVAMRRGAVLLLDETDYGSERLLCLQPILEGKPFFDKKTGEIIHPAPGFNVIATANTKGKGSDDGRFIGANVLNEAFLERFAITVEQEYPSNTVESKILSKVFAELGCSDQEFEEKLVVWADIIRSSFEAGAVNEIISTRRLVHIAKAFSIFKDRMKAVQLCLNRFDEDTKNSFLDLYTKVDQNAHGEQPAPAEGETTEPTNAF